MWISEYIDGKSEADSNRSQLIDILSQTACSCKLDPILPVLTHQSQLRDDHRLGVIIDLVSIFESKLFKGNKSASSLHTVAVKLVIPWSPSTVFPDITVAYPVTDIMKVYIFYMLSLEDTYHDMCPNPNKIHGMIKPSHITFNISDALLSGGSMC